MVVARTVSGVAVIAAALFTRGPKAALAAALLAPLAVASSGSAHASPQSASALLAPVGACSGANDARASETVQRSAIVCLVNWARKTADRKSLTTAPKLERASVLKGRVVVSCGQLSHSPCGADPTQAVKAAGYRYAWFGENLWFGTWGAFTARQVVASWLASPGHRANILRAPFRHFGIARVRAHDVFGEASTAVWVATFASPG
jgi:uncharacterized protein YkwD